MDKAIGPKPGLLVCQALSHFNSRLRMGWLLAFRAREAVSASSRLAEMAGASKALSAVIIKGIEQPQGFMCGPRSPRS